MKNDNNKQRDYIPSIRSEKDIQQSETELNLWRRTEHKKRQSVAREIAKREAKNNVNKYDPFAWDLIYSSLVNNAATPEDYGYKPEVWKGF